DRADVFPRTVAVEDRGAAPAAARHREVAHAPRHAPAADRPPGDGAMRDHAAIEELIALRALDGLDAPDERQLAVQRSDHGADCEECLRLESSYDEVAGRLAFADEPAEIREGLEDEIVALARGEETGSRDGEDGRKSAEAYELWTCRGKTPSSAGWFAPENGDVRREVSADVWSADALAITVESSACPAAPTSQPVMSGTV